MFPFLLNSNTIFILLNVLENKSTAYEVFGLTNPPRIAAFLWISWQLCPKTWWRYWLTLDNVQLNALCIYIINVRLAASSSAVCSLCFNHELAFSGLDDLDGKRRRQAFSLVCS